MEMRIKYINQINLARVSFILIIQLHFNNYIIGCACIIYINDF